jgi:hypothetical protein
MLVISANFNAYWSWNRHYNVSDRLTFPDVYNFTVADSVQQALKKAKGSICLDSTNYHILNRNLREATYKKFQDEFFDRQLFQIPIIGIKCSTNDILIVGTFGILILLIWYYYAARREGHVIAGIDKLLDDLTDKKHKLRKVSIINTCLLNSIFTTGTKADLTPWIHRITINFFILLPLLSTIFSLFCAGRSLCINNSGSLSIPENFFSSQQLEIIIHFCISGILLSGIIYYTWRIVTILNNTDAFFKKMQATKVSIEDEKPN